MPKKLTTQQFIEKANTVHKNRYIYDNVEYVNNKQTVKIICKEHDIFEQSPNMHLKGNGCPSCGGTKRLTSSIFIKNSKSVHGDTYLYSKTNYKTIKEKVTITCRKHDDFQIPPGKHLKGSGCPKCSNKYRRSKKEYIEEANILHNYKYKYDLKNYTSLSSVIKVFVLHMGCLNKKQKII